MTNHWSVLVDCWTDNCGWFVFQPCQNETVILCCHRQYTFSSVSALSHWLLTNSFGYIIHYFTNIPPSWAICRGSVYVEGLGMVLCKHCYLVCHNIDFFFVVGGEIHIHSWVDEVATLIVERRCGCTCTSAWVIWIALHSSLCMFVFTRICVFMHVCVCVCVQVNTADVNICCLVDACLCMCVYLCVCLAPCMQNAKN